MCVSKASFTRTNHFTLNRFGNCFSAVYTCSGGSRGGGFLGFHGTPLSAQLSSRSVYTVRSFSLDRIPLSHEQQDYSDYSSLTSVFERILVDYLP